MAALFWLTRAQIRRITSYFPLSHGVPRVDDQQVVSGLLHVLRNWLRWRDTPAGTVNLAGGLAVEARPARRWA